MMIVCTRNLSFEIGENADNARFIMPENNLEGRDFWRLILDDGLRTEIPVLSHEQAGKVTKADDAIVIAYDNVISEYGDVYNIAVKIKVETKGELLYFTPTLTNNSDVRINECFCPVCAFDGINGDKNADVLYMPYGLGSKAVNPYAKLESLTKEYYNHDDKETFWHLHYPQASMCWFGVESGDKFLYMSRYDEKIRCCFLTARHTIHSQDMALATDHFPMLREGESITFAATVIGLLDGNWTSGASEYRKWADSAFFKITDKADWVRDMTGWQRIIMRSQYGEDYYKPSDLPQLYKIGAKYGINTLFLFAWWKAGMDRNYPHYEEPYSGAFEDLRTNIDKVRDMGGRVILECNCHFIDPSTEFYRKHGDEVKIIDINGNEVRPAFVYPGMGEFRAKYGAKQFPVCCSGTERWRNQVLWQLDFMSKSDADCIFADCYGAAPTQPCFNDKHEHGNRVDEEWVYRRKFYDKAVELAANNKKVLAAEIVTDVAASYTQFLHGLFNVSMEPGSEQFPPMFRYTFPEVITTNRGVRCSEGDYEKQLKTAFVYGLRFDAELFVCRAALDRDEKYAQVIAECTALMNKYKKFILHGKFTFTGRKLPLGVVCGEFISQDGDQILTVLYNANNFAVHEYGIALNGGEMSFSVRTVQSN